MPSVGGIETVTDLMSRGFARQGHEISIVTNTPSDQGSEADRFPTLRNPSKRALWKAVKAADVVWQNNISLTYLWAALLQRKPTAVSLACAIFPDYPDKNWKVRLKARLLKRCHIFAISHYVMNGLDAPYDLVGNPFDADFSSTQTETVKDRDIVFAGRLVSDKGGDLLLQAIASLTQKGLRPNCTIIGDGPEKAPLEAMVKELGLTEQIHFTGYLTGRALQQEIARHRIMAVPSRWKEPFGVVALEGIASGCAIVGSSGGGLSDAIGPCGLTFENNDGAALAEKLSDLLSHPQLIEQYVSHANTHLERFSVDAQSAHYLKVFEQMLGK